MDEALVDPPSFLICIGVSRPKPANQHCNDLTLTQTIQEPAAQSASSPGPAQRPIHAPAQSQLKKASSLLIFLIQVRKCSWKSWFHFFLTKLVFRNCSFIFQLKQKLETSYLVKKVKLYFLIGTSKLNCKKKMEGA